MIVSPFNDLTGWDELKNIINETSGKIKIDYYVRKDEGMRGIEGINVNLFEVPLLHAKLFFSEYEAIISSGNLHSRLDINCTALLNKQEEYQAIVDFFERYIKPKALQLPAQ